MVVARTTATAAAYSHRLAGRGGDTPPGAADTGGGLEAAMLGGALTLESYALRVLGASRFHQDSGPASPSKFAGG